MKKYAICDDIYFDVGEEITILNKINTEDIIVLGDIESIIWSHIPEKSVGEIIALLKEEYEGDGIEEDVKGFIKSLEEKDIIKMVD